MTATRDTKMGRDQRTTNRREIVEWDVEQEEFWRGSGSRIAFRNLLISIPCLLFAFAIWLYWSIIIVQMQNLGFTFSTTQLYTLPAIAGLAGATLRIPNSFAIAISGGRNVIAVTTALLIVPAAGVGIALQNPATSYLTFAILASLSGIGGGAFASSMSNISFFFPKRMQGLSLGLNAGLGNVGVSILQVVLPWVTTFGLVGGVGGAGRAGPADPARNLPCAQPQGLPGTGLPTRLRALSLDISGYGCGVAETCGIILADTKFEFGFDAAGELLLIDEVLTPDSSRFWPQESYAVGRGQPSLDKQPVREWLDELQDWDKSPPAPELPDTVVTSARDRYEDVFHRLTGIELADYQPPLFGTDR